MPSKYCVTTETLEYTDEYYYATDGYDLPLAIFDTNEEAHLALIRAGIKVVRENDYFFYNRYEAWMNYSYNDLAAAVEKVFGLDLAYLVRGDHDFEGGVMQDLFTHINNEGFSDEQIAALLTELPA